MKKTYISTMFAIAITFMFAAAGLCADNSGPKTSFQTPSPWKSGLNIPADVAMVYGLNPDAVAAWKAKGFTAWSMFGASWLGKNEKIVVDNPDIVQRMAGGVPFEMIPGRAWVVPVGPWREHIKGIIDKLVAAGTGAVLPEEPEFFVGNGYSESFKRAWRDYYKEDWRAPNSSLTAQWKANRLKGVLFTDFFADVFAHTKSLDPKVLTLVPTHSNINYADWGIIAPQHAFFSLPVTDGMIGQVWTGTAKGSHPVGGDGARAVFDYAFLEYSYFANLAEGTGKQMWLLTDPVEDEPGAPWLTLRGWYEDTLTAALMQPGTNRYEVTPWPDRVLMASGIYGGASEPVIPQAYATELMTVWAAQGMIPEGGTIESGSDGVGFLTADSLMWQRGSGRDRFRGHAAPMLSLERRGIFVNLLPAERLLEKNYPPERVKMITASFDAWKPEKAEIVDALAAWVKRGGTLLFIGGSDDYDNIEDAWWKAEGRDTPADALLARLLPQPATRTAFLPNDKLGMSSLTGGVVTERKALKAAPGAPDEITDISTVQSPLPVTTYEAENAEVWMTSGGKPAVWTVPCGAGRLVYAGFPGEAVAQLPEGDKLFAAVAARAAAMTPGLKYATKPGVVVRRGKFVVAHAYTNEGLRLEGRFADLLKPESPVTGAVSLAKGGNAFLLDLNEAVKGCGPAAKACLLLAGGRIMGEKNEGNKYELKLGGPDGRFGSVWIYLPDKKGGEDVAPEAFGTPPGAAAVKLQSDWDADSGVLRATVPLSADGTVFSVSW